MDGRIDGWTGWKGGRRNGCSRTRGVGVGEFSDFATQCGKPLLGHGAGCPPLGAPPQASH